MHDLRGPSLIGRRGRSARLFVELRFLWMGLAFVWALNAELAAAELDWRLDLVDAHGDVGESPALVLDPDGYARIAYYDRDSRDVRMASWDGVMWWYETVAEDVLISSAPLGANPAIALACDPGDGYQVLYEVSLSDRHIMRHAVGNLYGLWAISQVDVSVDGPHGRSMNPSIVVDDNHVTHVLYSRPKSSPTHLFPDENRLIYGRLVGSLWQLEGISGTAGGRSNDYGGPSLAVDASGKAHVSYDIPESGGAFSLRYARRDGLNNWFMNRVDPLDSAAPIRCALALDYTGQPRIAYGFTTTVGQVELRYAAWNGSTWQIETVTKGSVEGYYMALVIDQVNEAHIAYVADGLTLAYAHRATQRWQIHTFDNGDNGDAVRPLAQRPSLALDLVRRPQVAFYGGWSRDGRSTVYKRWANLYLLRFSEKWQVRTVDNRGKAEYSSIAIDMMGSPHISYSLSDPLDISTTGPPYGLCYAVRDHGEWRTATVAPTESLGRGWYSSISVPSIVYIASAPRIASYRPDTGDLEFSFTSDGITWTTEIVRDPLKDDSADDVGCYSSLVAFLPVNHIAYWDNTNFRVKYARKDSEGWHVTSITDAPPLDRASGATVIGVGRPFDTGVAITYYDAVRSDVRLARFREAQEPIQWTDTLLVGGSEMQVGLYDFGYSEAGGSALAWHDRTNNQIVFAPTRNTGTTWTAVVASGISDVTDIAVSKQGHRGDSVVFFAEYPFPLRAGMRSWGSDTWTVDIIDPGGPIMSQPKTLWGDRWSAIKPPGQGNYGWPSLRRVWRSRTTPCSLANVLVGHIRFSLTTIVERRELRRGDNRLPC